MFLLFALHKSVIKLYLMRENFEIINVFAVVIMLSITCRVCVILWKSKLQIIYFVYVKKDTLKVVADFDD